MAPVQLTLQDGNVWTDGTSFQWNVHNLSRPTLYTEDGQDGPIDDEHWDAPWLGVAEPFRLRLKTTDNVFAETVTVSLPVTMRKLYDAMALFYNRPLNDAERARYESLVSLESWNSRLFPTWKRFWQVNSTMGSLNGDHVAYGGLERRGDSYVPIFDS